MIIVMFPITLIGQLVGFGGGWLLLGALGSLAYFVGFDVSSGATPGKRLLGYRLYGADGPGISAGGAVRRELFVAVGAIPFIGPLLVLVAWVSIAATISRSEIGIGWHDRLGMTHAARPAELAA